LIGNVIKLADVFFNTAEKPFPVLTARQRHSETTSFWQKNHFSAILKEQNPRNSQSLFSFVQKPAAFINDLRRTSLNSK
jgi:hypothetical protein